MTTHLTNTDSDHVQAEINAFDCVKAASIKSNNKPLFLSDDERRLIKRELLRLQRTLSNDWKDERETNNLIIRILKKL